jgi:hypothetical protein
MYMCEETGIGSGTLHSEDALFSTQKTAMLYASTQAEQKRKANPDCVEEDRKRQNKKDGLIVEPCPRQEMQDVINQLKQQVKELKKKLTRQSSYL